jgi:hypothetical protein
MDPSAAATADVQHMIQLLQCFTQPDTNTIRQAETTLKGILKRPESMSILWTILSNPSCDVSVRHMAAIVLRKRLPNHYSHKMTNEMQKQWQSQILTALMNEPIRALKLGLVGVAAAIANMEKTPSEYYLEFLTAAANDANRRELCFLLLSEMTETVGTHWKTHLSSLQNLFGTVLTTPNEPAHIQKSAIVSLGGLLSFWAEDPEMDALAPLLPALLNVSMQHDTDEDFLSTVLDVLYDLAYSSAPALLPHVGIIVEFALGVLRNPNLELRVRDAAALVIATSAEAKPKTLGRNEALLGTILDVLFQLMQDSSHSAAGALFESNPAWRSDLLLENHDGAVDLDEEGNDSPTETSMAQGTLDMLACEIPKKYIWNAAITRILEKMRSPDPNVRKAGVAGLGVIAEGCSEPLTANLSEIIPYVFAAASDPTSHQVRECACFALGQISEHCQPEILAFSEQVLPIVFQLLDDTSIAVQATSCYVLEMFCERLEPSAVRPVLDKLVRKLASMLEHSTQRSVQEMTVAALAATAVAAEAEFAPYVQGVAALMMKLMTLHELSQFSLRGRALECMGHIAIAVGRDHFRPYFATTMQCAMQGLTMDSTDLQEFAYAVFANLAKVMKEEFAPALPDLVPFLAQVIEQDDGQFEKVGGASGNDADGGGGGTPLITALDDSDDEDNDEANLVLHVRTALLEVKKGAITALGEMAAHTGTHFCPHLEISMQVLQKAANNWHPLIKAEVAEAMPSLIVPCIAAYHSGEIQWKKGDVETTTTTNTTTMSQHTATIVAAVLQEELALMKDDEKSVVSKACEAIQSVIELCGPPALLPVLNETLQCTLEILTKMAPCQTADVLYGELPDDDDDHDVVMQAACDLIGAFGRVLGGHFAQYLPQFLPAVVEYSKSSRPASDRGMSIGCLSEIAQELEIHIEPYWQSVFLPCILNGMADPEDNVKRNAVFCAGICAEHLGERIAAKDYPVLLQHIGPLFQMDSQHASNDTSASACVDNAAAAVCRMIMAAQSHVNMFQVLPVLLQALPLKTDMTENETVYKCLMGLLQMNNPDLLANASQVQRIFTEACSDTSNVEDEIKIQLRNVLSTLNAQ